MLSVTCFNHRFTSGGRILVLAVLAIILLIALGFWQLHRAEEKQLILTAEARETQLPPVEWVAGMPYPKQYQSIQVKGRYLSSVFLLDNQFFEHQPGYNVLSPYLLADGHLLLIDRGWIAGDRSHIPVLPPLQSAPHLSGRAYFPSAKSWVLGQEAEIKSDSITIVERIDVKLISNLLHKSVYPFIIRLNKDDVNGFTREWPTVTMSPQRHYAYALQWFALAFIALVVFIGSNLKKIND